jgi:pimeloyl-ACP methyl ester carboxylesterase
VHALAGLSALFVLAVVLFNGYAYARRAGALRSHPCAADRLAPVPALWAFVKECTATAFVLLLVPVGVLWPGRCTAPAERGPVVLLHDRNLTWGSLWLLRWRLRRDGWGPVCCLAYGSRTGAIETAARRLHGAVEALAAGAPKTPLTLIGHGLGGLVLRYYARRYPAAAVRRLVTLGTPHAGSLLGSRLTPLLRVLNAGDRVPKQFDVIAFSSTFDACILPPVNAQYPGAFNVVVPDVGHHMLLFSSKVYALLRENLAAPFVIGSSPMQLNG